MRRISGPHGTAVAGVAAARGGSESARRRVFLVPTDADPVLGLDGFAFNTNIADAIGYMIDHGAAVVNINLTARTRRRACAGRSSARASWRSRHRCRGRQGTAERQYPAAFPETIAVRRPRRTSSRAARASATGSTLPAAPECAPLTAISGGTRSAAASVSPLVAGIVGLMQKPCGSLRARPSVGAPLWRAAPARWKACAGDSRTRGRGTGVPRRPGPSIQPAVVFGQPATEARPMEAPVLASGQAGARRSLPLGRRCGRLRCDRRRDLISVCPYDERPGPTAPRVRARLDSGTGSLRPKRLSCSSGHVR